ncbi:DciA family protein [Streptomyces sp. MMS24-I29]|uniref:DciA family protein n=1 Tax=Streptomyces sp. MMS24-I29 TaxID=3351480 RepID=UPI003C7A9DD7
MTLHGNQPHEPPGPKLDLARVTLRAEKEAARRRVARGGQPVIRQAARRRRRGDDSAVPLHAAISELFADVIGDVPSRGAPTVISDWNNLVGPLARYLRPTSFDPVTGTLSVHAVSAAWATNTRLLAPKVIARLNEKMGSDQIRQLRIQAPAAPARTSAQRTASRLAPELSDALDRQRQATQREPEEHFQAGQEARARARRSQTAQQRSAIVHLRAQAKARQSTSADQPAARTGTSRPGQQRSQGEGDSSGGED